MSMLRPMSSFKKSSPYLIKPSDMVILKKARTLSPVDQEVLNQLEQVVQEMEEE